MTARLTHLTRDETDDVAFEVLRKILVDKKYIAGSGYISSTKKVVCMQEVPLDALERLREKDYDSGILDSR